MKIEHKLYSESIFEYDLSYLVTDELLSFIYTLRDKNLGQYNGLVSNTQRQNLNHPIDKKYKVSNFNGFQSFEHPYIRVNKHQDQSVIPLFNEISNLIRRDYDSRFDYSLNNYWFNINKKGSYNKKHNHINLERDVFGVSGVFYLSTPKDSGNIVFEAQNYEQLEIESKSGHLLLFPIYLSHLVQESKSDQDRVSFAFNYDGYLKKQHKALM